MPWRAGFARALTAAAILSAFAVATEVQLGAPPEAGQPPVAQGKVGGGWVTDPSAISEARWALGMKPGAGMPTGDTPCDWDVYDGASLTSSTFEAAIRGRGPALIRGGASNSSQRPVWQDRANFLESYGGNIVERNTLEKGANWLYMSVARVDGSRDHVKCGPLFSQGCLEDPESEGVAEQLIRAGEFEPPRFFAGLNSSGSSYSFALLSAGGSRGGLPFHQHGEAWFALLAGSKTWVTEVPFNEPGVSDTHALGGAGWVGLVGPGRMAGIEMCHQQPGDVVYFPEFYKHATFNLGESVGIGAQLQPARPYEPEGTEPTPCSAE